MDDIAAYNQKRWEELAKAGVVFSRPSLELDVAGARQMVDPEGILEDPTGQQVLCLAGGGGQQSVAFALLGAEVTVFDLSETQLELDRQAAAHHDVAVQTIQGDMRDLSAFPDETFDLVWHAYSINFVPEVTPVLDEVTRILRPGGLYRIEIHNPFFMGLGEEDWDGHRYPLNIPYVEGVERRDLEWDVKQPDGSVRKILGPMEFRHTLGKVVRELVAQGIVILGLWEELATETDPAPGTWEHFKQMAPPWLTIWGRYLPEVFDRDGGKR